MKLFDRLIATSLPHVPRGLVGRFARPYVAGETQEQALARVRELQRKQLSVTLDVLGEDITRSSEADAATEAYLRLLDAIAESGLEASISVKLTAFGLKLDRGLGHKNLRRVLERAAAHDNFVRIDMEDSSCTDDTLELYEEVRGEFPAVGVVLQAMLRRTFTDAKNLAAVGADVRLCKGIYIEPEAIAFGDAEEVRESYMASLEALLGGAGRIGIATHDDVLIEASIDLLRDTGRGSGEGYEFQMLLGVRQPLRDSIVKRGHPLRVYVPFGEHWYAYSLRRLRENPAVAGHVARAFLRGEWRSSD